MDTKIVVLIYVFFNALVEDFFFICQKNMFYVFFKWHILNKVFSTEQ